VELAYEKKPLSSIKAQSQELSRYAYPVRVGKREVSMGLYVHSLGEVPSGATRKYYVYLLDYGWDEPLGEAVRKNISHMADRASRSNAAVIHGPRGIHFADEVLSWHHINGQPAEKILPALLITTRHPKTIRGSFQEGSGKKADDALLLIPLKKACKNATEVVTLIDQVFTDIKDEKRLKHFAVAKQMRRGVKNAIVNAAILQPKIGGFGIDLRKFFSGILEE
jgi:hypothetical protein